MKDLFLASPDSTIMDKKSVIQMLLADFARFDQESKDITKTVDDVKQDVRNYMNALIAQMSSSGPRPLLAKTPKLPKKRTTRIKAIPENDEMDENDGSLLNSSRSSRADVAVMETTEIRSGRAKRGASVKAADNIKKQQSMTLTSKMRRPSSTEESDVPLANRVRKILRVEIIILYYKIKFKKLTFVSKIKLSYFD